MIWLPLLLVAGAAALAKSRGVSLGAAPGSQRSLQQQRPRGLGDLPDTEGPGFRRVGGRPVTAVDDDQRVISRGTLDALAFSGAQRPFAARGGYDDGGVDNFETSRSSGISSGTVSVGAPTATGSGGTGPGVAGAGGFGGPGNPATTTGTGFNTQNAIGAMAAVAIGIANAVFGNVIGAVVSFTQAIAKGAESFTTTTTPADVGFPAGAAEDAAVEAQMGVFGVPGPEAVGLSSNDVGLAADAEGGAVDAGPTGISASAASSLGFTGQLGTPGAVAGEGSSPSQSDATASGSAGYTTGNVGASPSDTGPAPSDSGPAPSDSGAPGDGGAGPGDGGAGDGGGGDGGDGGGF